MTLSNTEEIPAPGQGQTGLPAARAGAGVGRTPRTAAPPPPVPAARAAEPADANAAQDNAAQDSAAQTSAAQTSAAQTSKARTGTADPADTAADAAAAGFRGTTGTFAALRIPNYRRYLSGQMVSMCGSWMQTIALSWLVLTLGASGTELGLVTAAQFLPVLLFGAYGGLIADRVDTRRLLYCTQLTAALFPLTLGILVFTGVVQLWMVVIAAACIGTISAIDNPARQSFVQEMVSPDLLPNAVTLNSIAMNGARVVGPAIAGTMIALVGTGGCFLLNAASFAALPIALTRMNRSELRPTPPVPRAHGQLRAGFAYVMRVPELRVPLVMMFLIGALSYEFQVVLPLVAKESFGGTASTYSLFTAAMGAGAVVGGLLVARYRRVGIRALWMTAGIFGLLNLVAAAAPVLALEIVALVAMGAASIAFISTGNATIQLASDPQMRGRVMALWSVALLGTTPIGGPIAGWVAETFGARAGLVLAGVAALAGAGYALTSARSTGGGFGLRRTRQPVTPAVSGSG